MNTVKILHNYCNYNNKKKKIILYNDGYYSEIINFSLNNILSQKILLLIPKIVFNYVGIIENTLSLNILKLDSDVSFIRGNIIEKSVVIIKNDVVIKVYEDISSFSKEFYKHYYEKLIKQNNKFFLLPDLISTFENKNLFIVKFKKINNSNHLISLSDIKKISESLTFSLSNVGISKKIDNRNLVTNNSVVKSIDKLISKKLSDSKNIMICHGDFWRDNLLQDDTKKRYIIDFDNIKKLPAGFDFIYYVLNEINFENNFFFKKVLNKQKVVYSKIDEFLCLSNQNIQENEFLFFAFKFRYNLLNNSNYNKLSNEILIFLESMYKGYSVINNINRNE